MITPASTQTKRTADSPGPRGGLLADHLAVGWTLFAAVTLLLLFHGWGFDDPFVTYRYAANLAAGNGFVYNVDERVLSTTTPLYALLLALLRLMRLDLPLVSNAIGCGSIALGGWALMRLAHLWQAPAAGVAVLILYSTFPLFVTTLGAETTFYVALILWAFLLYERQRYIPAAILLALAALTRADGILAAIPLAVDFLAGRRQPIPWRALALYVTLGLVWLVGASLYFGSPFPATLAAKQQQGQLAASRSFLDGAASLVADYWRVPLYRVHFALAVLGLGYGLWRKRRCFLLLAWNMLYLAAYVVLGVSRYHWYYAPLVAGAIVLVAVGIEALSRIAGRYFGRRIARCLAVGLILVSAAPQVWSLVQLWQMNDARAAIYREVGTWINNNTPTDASVGTLEVGIIGYYADRRMIDFAGLIQPETAMQLTSTTTYEDAAIWAVHHFQPSYLVLQDGLFPRLEQDQAVLDACRQTGRWTDEAYPFQLVVYHCTF